MDTHASPSITVVLHTGGLLYSGEAAIVERALRKQRGVVKAEANPVSQTTTVTFDPSQTSVAGLRTCVQECGYQCAGQSVPTHLYDPLEEPAARHQADQLGQTTEPPPWPT